MTRILMKGNEAIAEAAIRAGAIYYFAYPITPQNEVGEYMARRLPEVGGVFVQAESEVAVGNMLFGAAASGKRVFTSSSSPGISLMQEAISYMAITDRPDQHHARRSRIGRHSSVSGGLLPVNQRRRSRRLPRVSSGAEYATGSG
jgi:pyruvate/2-oxoacid:ferredoxin oxidoreductase alpha subunit